MRKVFVICLSILICLLLVGCNKYKDTFQLEEKYYGSSDFIELSKEKLDTLINNKESFAIFIYQPLCTTSVNFEKVLQEFVTDNQVSFYKMSFSNIKDTKLGKRIKYFPSFAIFNKGEMVDYLEANSDKDTKIYKSTEEFKKWFTKYVILKENNSLEYGKDDSNNQDTQEQDFDISDINLKYIKEEKNKVNIYFFWGDGCPHCEQELEFFKTIEKDYGKRYNLYTFEVWYNEENVKLLQIFASAMGDKLNGIPYTIIGNKSFTGFDNSSKKEFEEAINSQYKDSYDIYFDKIKKS